jgi:hypothetical protein
MVALIVSCVVAILVLGCGTTPSAAPSAAGLSPSPSASASSVSAAPSSSAAASGIGATLPTQLGGVTFGPPEPLTTEFLGPLAQQLGIDPGTLEGAVARPTGESGGTDIAVVRAPGVATDKLAEAFMDFNAKALDVPAGAKPTRENIGGKDVLVTRTPGVGGGTFLIVVYAKGDTAYMVAGESQPAIDEALSKLP